MEHPVPLGQAFHHAVFDGIVHHFDIMAAAWTVEMLIPARWLGERFEHWLHRLERFVITAYHHRKASLIPPYAAARTAIQEDRTPLGQKFGMFACEPVISIATIDNNASLG